MAKPPKELLDAIHESLAERPEEWCIRKEDAWHAGSGVAIHSHDDPMIMWLSVRGERFSSADWALLLGWLVPWRVRLCLAVWRAAPPPRVVAEVAISDAILALRATPNA